MSSCEVAIWRFGIGVFISCTVFTSFYSGHFQIAADSATRVQPCHSLPPVSQQKVSYRRNVNCQHQFTSTGPLCMYFLHWIVAMASYFAASRRSAL